MKKRIKTLKTFFTALAAVAAAAAELSAQPVVGAKLLQCEGRDAAGRPYETTVSVSTQAYRYGVSTSYQVSTRQVGQDFVAAHVANGAAFTFAGGGILSGPEGSLVLGAWDDNGVMQGRLQHRDLLVQAPVPLACRRVADSSPGVNLGNFPKADKDQIAAVLAALVIAHEGIPLNADESVEDAHLQVAPDLRCETQTAGTLRCGLDYWQGRWNGEVSAEFAIDGDSVVRLLGVAYDGSF